MYKVGDKVRVIKVDDSDVSIGLSVGDIYILNGGEYEYQDNTIRMKLNNGSNYYLYTSQIEKVEESKDMTFPEMVQKLIDGEFEVGTELVALDQDDEESIFYVTANSYGYGITDMEHSLNESNISFPTKMNAKWTANSIKEMSFEEVQQELGYKIKIVE